MGLEEKTKEKEKESYLGDVLLPSIAAGIIGTGAYYVMLPLACHYLKINRPLYHEDALFLGGALAASIFLQNSGKYTWSKVGNKVKNGFLTFIAFDNYTGVLMGEIGDSVKNLFSRKNKK